MLSTAHAAVPRPASATAGPADNVWNFPNALKEKVRYSTFVHPSQEILKSKNAYDKKDAFLSMALSTYLDGDHPSEDSPMTGFILNDNRFAGQGPSTNEFLLSQQPGKLPSYFGAAFNAYHVQVDARPSFYPYSDQPGQKSQ